MDEIKAKKKFGQNFLIDQSIISKIIEAMPHTNHPIAEIGPGLGDLTRHLVKIKSVTAFEVDTDLCKHLSQEFQEELQDERFTLHCGDVLERWGKKSSDISASLVDEKYDLVANLPYYIATKIILQALEDPLCQNILVMVQKEVADKFSANVGDKEFSALAVLTQTSGKARTVVNVPPESFNPPPKIDSAVVLVEKSGILPVEGLSGFLKIAFAQPRKTLAKNLSSHIPKDVVKQALTSLNLSATIRPHETSTLMYQQLFSQLKGTFDGSKQQRKQSKRTRSEQTN
jgi:16S rRNA (adenine1518-N6/adenine1519-N6)-dimethyltransferase